MAGTNAFFLVNEKADVLKMLFFNEEEVPPPPPPPPPAVDNDDDDDDAAAAAPGLVRVPALAAAAAMRVSSSTLSCRFNSCFA